MNPQAARTESSRKPSRVACLARPSLRVVLPVRLLGGCPRRAPAPLLRAAAVTDAKQEQTEASAATQAPESENFVWPDNWYPVAPVEFIDPSRPHPFTLLGNPLVLWKDGSGLWRAFADACPHRLAPLSEGRIEKDGSLLCAYHAWRFDGKGRCTNIPQAKDTAALELACRNPRSCAKSYPTTVAQGLLWVWGEAGELAEVESAANSPAIVPEAESDRALLQPWYFRDLPYGADYFIENVTDPAHVNVSHHNVAGSRYEEDQYIIMHDDSDSAATTATTTGTADQVDAGGHMPASSSGSASSVHGIHSHSSSNGGSSGGSGSSSPAGSKRHGFKFSIARRGLGPFGNRSATTEYLPPALVKTTFHFDNGSSQVLQLYAVPTTPGKCRHIGRQMVVKSEAGELPKLLRFFGRRVPVWLSHTLASVFLHQDQVFLHTQQINARRAGSDVPAIEKYFMPTSADRMTIAFRTWMERMAGGGIAFAPGSPPPPLVPAPKAELFDTYTTHTAKCSVCCKALANLMLAHTLTLAIGVGALSWGVACTCLAAAAKSAVSTAAGGTVSATASATAPMPVVSQGAVLCTGAAALGPLLLSCAPPSAWAALVVAMLALAAATLLHKLIDMMHKYEFTHADND